MNDKQIYTTIVETTKFGAIFCYMSYLDFIRFNILLGVAVLIIASILLLYSFYYYKLVIIEQLKETKKDDTRRKT